MGHWHHHSLQQVPGIRARPRERHPAAHRRVRTLTVRRILVPQKGHSVSIQLDSTLMCLPQDGQLVIPCRDLRRRIGMVCSPRAILMRSIPGLEPGAQATVRPVNGAMSCSTSRCVEWRGLLGHCFLWLFGGVESIPPLKMRPRRGTACSSTRSQRDPGVHSPGRLVGCASG